MSINDKYLLRTYKDADTGINLSPTLRNAPMWIQTSPGVQACQGLDLVSHVWVGVQICDSGWKTANSLRAEDLVCLVPHGLSSVRSSGLEGAHSVEVPGMKESMGR